MSTKNLPIKKTKDELDAEVREIYKECYEKIFDKNDAEFARNLGVAGSTSKFYREDMQIPGWVLLFIWKRAPHLLRDRIIDRALATDPTNDLSDEDAAMVRDFAEMLRNRRTKPARDLDSKHTKQIVEEAGHEAIDREIGNTDRERKKKS